MTGREIFLKQLSTMADYKKTVNFFNINIEEIDIQTFSASSATDYVEKKVLEKAKEFQVPKNLLTAFYAYYLDYLDPDGCVHESGAFWSGEDITRDIRDKLFFFFDPIFCLIAQKYFPEHLKINLYTIIEPCYDDSSSIVCFTRSHYSYSNLPLQVVLYDGNWKVWHNFFYGPDRAENVYKKLLEIYSSTADNAVELLKLLSSNK